MASSRDGTATSITYGRPSSRYAVLDIDNISILDLAQGDTFSQRINVLNAANAGLVSAFRAFVGIVTISVRDVVSQALVLLVLELLP